MLEVAAPFLWLLGPLAAVLLLPLVVLAALTAEVEIGRASCRERV